MTPPTPDRVVIAVSGGSGVTYAFDLLEQLRPADVEVHLVVTQGAKQVLPSETDATVHDLHASADVVHDDRDLGAAIASGSFRFRSMAIVPCSAGTLAKVATGFTDNLVARTAHVALKERRPLVAVVREAPYSRPMLENMLKAHDAGTTLVPASPGFYHRPETLADAVGSVTARVLDHLGVPHARSPRWKEDG